MNNPITKVYLLDVPLENDYKNTLYFANASAQQTYFQSRIIGSYSYDNFTYQRKDQIIRIPEQYDKIYKCNYVMYQNANYSNKWFYAFVTELEYINDGRTDLHIETDVMQTWMFDYTVKSSFVEREHTSNDTVGANTIPESLETGEYINQQVSIAEERDLNFLNLADFRTNVVLAVTELGLGDHAQRADVGNYNSIFGGLIYLTFPSFQDAKEYIYERNQHLTDDNIVAAFMCPSEIAEYGDNFEWLSFGNPPNDGFQYAYVEPNNFAVEVSSVNITKPTVLDKNYTPRNKKLLTYPYVYFNITNNGGSATNYMYEYFTEINGGSINYCPFTIRGAIGVGCSIKLIPIHYKYGKTGLNTTELNYIESLDACKLPTCSWTNDAFTNWLTGNAVNLPLNILGSGASIIEGGIKGNPSDAVNGLTNIFSQVGQMYERSLMPATAKGGVNQGDFNFAQHISFTAYKMSIKEEFARVIDDYFDMFGYKTNRVKVPNKNHRQRWWYTKTINVNINGNVPQNDMQKIKKCYDNGITFWRNASEIENYSLSNNII